MEGESGVVLIVRNKTMKISKKKEIAKKMGLTSHEKDLGNKLFSSKLDNYHTSEHKEYIDKMSPGERGRVNIHMGRLHRRKNNSDKREYTKKHHDDLMKYETN